MALQLAVVDIAIKCPGCDETKPHAAFYTSPRFPAGIRKPCKECVLSAARDGIKRCRECRVAKRLSEFPPRHGSKGTRATCSECVAPGTRRCTACREIKVDGEFNRRGGTRSGSSLRYDCKECQGKRRSAYFDKTRDKETKRTMAWQAAHPERTREIAAKYHANHRDELNAKGRERFKDENVKIAHRKYALRKNYGITVADYDRMLIAQGGRCAICRSDKPGGHRSRFNVDHDHATGKPRGLLCIRCNTGIGGLRDDVLILRAAISYLENPPWR